MATKETPATECVLSRPVMMGESPVWSHAEQVLYWINVDGEPGLQRFDPSSGANSTWAMRERLGGMALGSSGTVLLALASGIYRYELGSGALTCVARNEAKHLALHEGRCDRQGRFWIGSLDVGFFETGVPSGAVFHRLDRDRLSVEVRGIALCANGLAWSPDGRCMYWADSSTRQIFAADYDVDSGTPRNQRLFATIEETAGMPDGAAVDVDGGYWIALFQGGALRRYTPDGKLDREVQLPISQPTMLGFGGRDLKTAYVTSTYYGLDADESARGANGCLFALNLGVQGVPEPLFR